MPLRSGQFQHLDPGGLNLHPGFGRGGGSGPGFFYSTPLSVDFLKIPCMFWLLYCEYTKNQSASFDKLRINRLWELILLLRGRPCQYDDFPLGLSDAVTEHLLRSCNTLFALFQAGPEK